MRFILFLLMLGGVIAGCRSAPAERRPADDVSWANEQIDAQRVIKRRLLLADPIERRVEAHLQRDPRVKSARFAIVIPGFGCSGVSDTAPFSFATVVAARQPMTDEEARQLLQEACSAAEASLNLHYSEIVRDGDTWAVRSGSIQPTTQENPDLSALRAD